MLVKATVARRVIAATSPSIPSGTGSNKSPCVLRL